MTIYVDELTAYGQAPQPGAGRHFGNGKMSCHMATDGDLEELHEFALSIGLRRSWFQNKSTPHYDLTPGKRLIAVALGAAEVSTRDLILLCKPKVQVVSKSHYAGPVVVFSPDDGYLAHLTYPAQFVFRRERALVFETETSAREKINVKEWPYVASFRYLPVDAPERHSVFQEARALNFSLVGSSCGNIAVHGTTRYIDYLIWRGPAGSIVRVPRGFLFSEAVNVDGSSAFE